jgi:hypothetical protein
MVCLEAEGNINLLLYAQEDDQAGAWRRRAANMSATRVGGSVIHAGGSGMRKKKMVRAIQSLWTF